VRRVATGWAELQGWIGRRIAQDNRDLEATWTWFQKLVASSERAVLLKHIVRVGLILPDQERYQLAVVTTRQLAPIEWPIEWSEARPALVAALDTLVDETCPDEKVSFFALHDLGVDAELERVGHLVLINARDILRRPCRRDDLPSLARLCNLGSATCLGVYRRVISQSGEGASIDQDARTRYRSAFEGYAAAARALNDAVGAVLFEGLDAVVPWPCLRRFASPIVARPLRRRFSGSCSST